MFIHEMTASECRDALQHARFGRLACAVNDQPYILPMNYALDENFLYLYGFTTVGKKVEWMRVNPLVSFEIDDVIDHNHWTSVIIFGRYEELPDAPEFEASRTRAHAYLQKRAMWWEPAFISQDHRDKPHSLTPIFFRIRIETMTGHRASSDDQEEGTMALPRLSSEETPPAQPAVVEKPWLMVLKAAFFYFAIVFGIGTLFGPIRILLAVPRLGERLSELLEISLMLLIIILTAYWVVRRFHIPPNLIYRLGVGLIALTIGILFEFTLILGLRGLTLTEYFATRDIVAASVYYLTLVLFALMPVLVRTKPG